MIGLLCLDLGTSSAKAALIDLEGRPLATASASYPTASTPDGGSEQDPEDWIRAARTAIAQVLPRADDVAALCLTGQMQDLILEGEDGALRPAILYTDQRAAAQAREIRETLAREGIDWDTLCGNLQDATSCAAMFRRLARTEPDAVGRAEALTFGPAGHLAHRLGAGRWCDPTTASTTGLLDARTREWSRAVARAAGIDEALLPRLTNGLGQVVGRSGASARELLGLDEGVPIVLAPGDAGAAALGVTGTSPGRDHASLGTSGWIASIRATGDSSPHSADASHRLALGDHELRISAVLSAGAAAAWVRETFLHRPGPDEADVLLAARERQYGRGPTGLLVLPSLGGERYPVRDDALRGAVLGLEASTRPIDLYAATLEGVAFALSHALERGDEGNAEATLDGRVEPAEVVSASAAEDGPAPKTHPAELTVVGGGAASAPWRRILADVTGRPIRLPHGADSPANGDVQIEATLIGAAIAAAEALGFDHGITPLAQHEGEVTLPDPSAAGAYAELRPAHRALYEAAATIGAMHR
ncbi:sugar kinase [Brachybacterium halotolerans subsp. kimchii]|uniref:xylulokinase n=1 Tax=Brachybacterium halotolerans TaxID=2795215 RepID=UPI001E5FF1FE|nr:FGGY family carbohydrate kinase [Brachybacterium halotolerans]UEJ81857.1 sugar kinase [Brachybacterium halotolerans subsp. kimchii]